MSGAQGQDNVTAQSWSCLRPFLLRCAPDLSKRRTFKTATSAPSSDCPSQFNWTADCKLLCKTSPVELSCKVGRASLKDQRGPTRSSTQSSRKRCHPSWSVESQVSWWRDAVSSGSWPADHQRTQHQRSFSQTSFSHRDEPNHHMVPWFGSGVSSWEHPVVSVFSFSKPDVTFCWSAAVEPL